MSPKRLNNFNMLQAKRQIDTPLNLISLKNDGKISKHVFQKELPLPFDTYMYSMYHFRIDFMSIHISHDRNSTVYATDSFEIGCFANTSAFFVMPKPSSYNAYIVLANKNLSQGKSFHFDLLLRVGSGYASQLTKVDNSPDLSKFLIDQRTKHHNLSFFRIPSEVVRSAINNKVTEPFSVFIQTQMTDAMSPVFHPVTFNDKIGVNGITNDMLLRLVREDGTEHDIGLDSIVVCNLSKILRQLWAESVSSDSQERDVQLKRVIRIFLPDEFDINAIKKVFEAFYDDRKLNPIALDLYETAHVLKALLYFEAFTLVAPVADRMAFHVVKGESVVPAMLFAHKYDMEWLQTHCEQLINMYGDKVFLSEDWGKLNSSFPEVVNRMLRANTRIVDHNPAVDFYVNLIE